MATAEQQEQISCTTQETPDGPRRPSGQQGRAPIRTGGGPVAIRITERDRQAVARIVEAQLIRLDDLGGLLAGLAGSPTPIGLRTTRDVVRRWVTLGLVEVQRCPVGGPGMVSPTPYGARWVGLPAPRPVAWTEIPHTLTVSAVMAGYLRTPTWAAWESESALRRTLPDGQHRPDGIAVTSSGARYAVEVERNAKCAQRWSAITADLLAHHVGAHYWTTEPVGRAFGQWVATYLPPEMASRVQIYALAGAAR